MSEAVSAEVYHLVCKQVDELRDERDRLLLRVKDLEKQVDRLEDAAIHAEEDF